MLIDIAITIDNTEPISRSYNIDDITFLDWDEIVRDIYDTYEDKGWAEKCRDEKEEMRNYDKLKV